MRGLSYPSSSYHAQTKTRVTSLVLEHSRSLPYSPSEGSWGLRSSALTCPKPSGLCLVSIFAELRDNHPGCLRLSP